MGGTGALGDGKWARSESRTHANLHELMSPPHLSIVIANWNGGHFLRRCVSSIQISARASGRSHELIVVDDASDDDSVAMVRAEFPRVRLLANPRNVGFARSVNRGVRASRGRVLVLTNNDIVAREPFIENLVRWFDEKRTSPLFAVSAKTVSWYDGKPNQLCMGAVWRGGRITPAWSDPGEAAPCLFAQAGAAAYDARLFKKLGGLSCLYAPGYWEDYDLSWRAARRGWSQLYDPEAFVLHIGGGSMTKRYGADGVALMRARNHLLFEAANLRSPRLLAEWCARLPVQLAREFPRARQPFTRALFAAAGRYRQVANRRFREPSGLTDEKILSPFRHFTVSE